MKTTDECRNKKELRKAERTFDYIRKIIDEASEEILTSKLSVEQKLILRKYLWDALMQIISAIEYLEREQSK